MFLNKLINKGYEAESCQLCHTEFNLMKLERIHKCKRCNKYICLKCGKNKQKVLDADGKWTKQVHRICIPCQQDFLQIHETIKNYDMQWNRDTIISIQWLQNIKKDEQRLKDYEYEHYLKLFNSNLQLYQEEAQIIDKDVIKGRTDSSVFNFSMREFFYTVKADIQNQISRQNIKNILYAVAARFDKIGYCQGMSGVAAFLLCFSSQKTAYIIFCDLLENIYPSDFFLKNQYGCSLSGLLAETFFLQKYFIYLLEHIKKPVIQKVRGQFYHESQIQHFRTIIELVGSKSLLSLFVGIVSFSTCIFIWQEIKQHRSFEVVQKAFLGIIYLNRQKILQNRSFKIIQQIFQRMNLEQFKQFYYDIEIDQQIRLQFINQYHQNLSKKWDPTSDHQVKNLSKVTNFSVSELILLKNSFPQHNQTNICIKYQDFVKIVLLFNQILQKDFPNDIIFSIKKQTVQKIVQQYDKNKKQGLNFRQFVICLSICTKGSVKDRIRAIINSLRDNQSKINFGTTPKLNNQSLDQKRADFFSRVKKYYNKEQNLNVKDLENLLNDDYINQLSVIVRSDAQSIMERLIELYQNQ